MLRKYVVPADRHPIKKAVTSLYSKLNSSVKSLILHKNTPTQNPKHKGHLNNSPNFPLLGLILLKIEPYTSMNVMPYEHKIK